MSIKETTTYQTTDGKEFTDRSAAETHESALSSLSGLEEFLDSMTPAGGSPGDKRERMRVSNVVVAWERFKAMDLVQEGGE